MEPDPFCSYNDALAKEAGPQRQLNRIIAALDFSD
jgi:hypothetical protein